MESITAISSAPFLRVKTDAMLSAGFKRACRVYRIVLRGGGPPVLWLASSKSRRLKPRAPRLRAAPPQSQKTAADL